MLFFLYYITLLFYTPLTQSEAELVVQNLKAYKHIVIYDACIAESPARIIQTDSVYYQYNKVHKSYEIFLTGQISQTFEVNKGTFHNLQAVNEKWSGIADLANIYVPVRSNDNFYKVRSNLWDVQCIGTVLEIQCYPCIDFFEYPYQEP